jgi:hypothetical protein
VQVPPSFTFASKISYLNLLYLNISSASALERVNLSNFCFSPINFVINFLSSSKSLSEIDLFLDRIIFLTIHSCNCRRKILNVLRQVMEVLYIINYFRMPIQQLVLKYGLKSARKLLELLWSPISKFLEKKLKKKVTNQVYNLLLKVFPCPIIHH